MFKNVMVEAAAAQWIKSQTKAVREVRHVRLDTTEKTAEIEVDLAGESQPVSIQVGRYEVTETGGQCYIQVGEVRSSKEWLAILAAEQLCGRRFPIPNAVRGFL